MNIVYLNNIKVSPNNKISLYNGSFLYGINCFEGVRGYYVEEKKETKIFLLDEHLDRLYSSIKYLKFNFSIKKNKLKSDIYNIIDKEKIKEDIYIRITVFIGSDSSWAETDDIEYFISIRSMKSNLNKILNRKLFISKYKRITKNSVPPSIKAGANYLNSRYSKLEAISNGFDDSLMLTNNNFISESSGSCIFFIKDDSLYTPSLNCDILGSITRSFILNNSKNIFNYIFEDEIKVSDLSNFDCCFVVGTMIELQLISKINEINYNNNSTLLKRFIKEFTLNIKKKLNQN